VRTLFLLPHPRVLRSRPQVSSSRSLDEVKYLSLPTLPFRQTLFFPTGPRPPDSPFSPVKPPFKFNPQPPVAGSSKRGSRRSFVSAGSPFFLLLVPPSRTFVHSSAPKCRHTFLVWSYDLAPFPSSSDPRSRLSCLSRLNLDVPLKWQALNCSLNVESGCSSFFPSQRRPFAANQAAQDWVNTSLSCSRYGARLEVTTAPSLPPLLPRASYSRDVLNLVPDEEALLLSLIRLLVSYPGIRHE